MLLLLYCNDPAPHLKSQRARYERKARSAALAMSHTRFQGRSHALSHGIDDVQHCEGEMVGVTLEVTHQPNSPHVCPLVWHSDAHQPYPSLQEGADNLPAHILALVDGDGDFSDAVSWPVALTRKVALKMLSNAIDRKARSNQRPDIEKLLGYACCCENFFPFLYFAQLKLACDNCRT